MNVLENELSRASARNTSPKAQASTLFSDPDTDWRKVYRIDLAAIDLLERLAWTNPRLWLDDNHRPVLCVNRWFFPDSL